MDEDFFSDIETDNENEIEQPEPEDLELEDTSSSDSSGCSRSTVLILIAAILLVVAAVVHLEHVDLVATGRQGGAEHPSHAAAAADHEEPLPHRRRPRDRRLPRHLLLDPVRALDERLHELVGDGSRQPDLAAFTATIFTDKFKSQAEGTDFEMGVLSIGMTLESNANKYFSGAADNAKENEVREFYTFLADWEKQHFEALQNLHQSVRQDHWSEGRFSPF